MIALLVFPSVGLSNSLAGVATSRPDRFDITDERQPSGSSNNLWVSQSWDLEIHDRNAIHRHTSTGD